MSNKLWGGLLLLSLLTACNLNLGEEEKEDRLLAKVHNKALYLSELDGMFPEGTSAGDSAIIIDTYTQRWIRGALILHEAEQNIPSDLNIDKLVRDYRASLIRHNYEKVLVEELLDSVVTYDQLVRFYETNKQQYQLETPIVRCFFMKVPLPVPEPGRLQELWNNSTEDKPQELLEYCTEHAEMYLLSKDDWYRVQDIAQEMPNGMVTADNVSNRLDISRRDENYQYYFKVFEVKNRKDIAPLSFIQEQARKVILRKRKEKLLEEKIETMYDRELRRNNIETYYDKK